MALLLTLVGVAQSAGQRVAENGPDFLISSMGGTDPFGYYEADYPDVAYNSTDNNFFAVWRGEEEVGSLVDGEYEIFGAYIYPGAPRSPHWRISTAGPDGDYDYEAQDPVIAYNSTNNEYMIAWYAPADADLYDIDVYVSRFIPTTNTVTTDFEVSVTPDPPPPCTDSDEADYPDIAYNPMANEYLVVWSASIIDHATCSKQFEIFARRLSNTGALLGSQIRISTMGPEYPDAEWTYYNGDWPAVAYNPAGNSYLVVWVGDTNAGSLVDNELEIWGQRVDGTSGALQGGNVRISTSGTDGDQLIDSHWPDVAADPDSGQFLVVWQDEREVDMDPDIWGQRLHSGTGALLGANFQISETLPAGPSPQWAAMRPAATYNPADREYLVVWEGSRSELGENRWEVWGQVIDPDGNEIGLDDFRISNATLDSDPEPWSRSANEPAVVFSTRLGEYLAIWSGYFPPQQYYDDHEIFGQRLMPDKLRTFVGEH